MVHYFTSLDRWLHKHLVVLLLLLSVVLLRIPNFFEPYWYGDEGIYLTIGNGIRHGERLYTEIVDHKTPLIYYLAAVPNQLSFRILLLAWMLVTTVAFYHLARKLIPDPIGQVAASIIFVIFTTIPYFEGNIPNGELFVMGFVLVGGWIMTRTSLFSTFLTHTNHIDTDHDVPFMALAGGLFGLAILTKVPAVLDFGAFLFLAWLTLVQHWQHRKAIIVDTLAFGIGALVPIMLSVLYFTMVGSGKDYLAYGLLYNFRYAESWGLTLPSILLEKIFTLPGKTLIMGYVLLTLTIRRKWFSQPLRFIAGWFVMAVFAALLSNRPYPHYFMQVVPPLALLVGLVINRFEHFKVKYLTDVLMAIGVYGLLYGALVLVHFSPYKTQEYYDRFVQLMTGRLTVDQYRQSFNVLMTDNYRAAKIIREADAKQIFIWGTNAMLYAQTGTYPVGKYTVAFHIRDFKAEAETVKAIKVVTPPFIVMMRDETEQLPELNQFLVEKYLPNSSFTYFTLWRRADTISHTIDL